MNSKFLAVLTSPFWGPRKLDELHDVATKNLETADKLVQDTGENLKKVDALYLQIQEFQRKQEDVSEAQKKRIAEGTEALKSLIETVQLVTSGIEQDRAIVKNLQENCEATLKQANEVISSGKSHTAEAEVLLKKNNDLSVQLDLLKKDIAKKEEFFSSQAMAILHEISNEQQKIQNLSNTSQDALKNSDKLRSEVTDILEEVKKLNTQNERNITEAKQQVISNNQTVQSLISSTSEIISGLKNDREELKTLRHCTEETLKSASTLLQESQENKRQAELLLQEAADKRDLTLLVNKKRAAMALNLCTTSISRIIASGNVEVMEQEYNAILNNINLQVIVKDEALLSTMRKILDTIIFFRLQEKERKLLEARHHQRMNKLLWESLSSGGGLFVVGGDPWTIAAAAAIQAGSMYVGYQNKKREAGMQLEEELWKLERSAIEQLHALRASLFETAWRLSDTYNFNDEWRLTVRQIEWYNEIRSEADHITRYKKLEQYKEDFEAYPYFWYELGVAAQGVYDEKQALKEPGAETWRDNAEKHLSKFLELDHDLNLLRQDIIGADARLRHVALLAGKIGWAKAVQQDDLFLKAVKRLAVDDPELLLKAALVYASAYKELSNSNDQSAAKEPFAHQAIVFFEMLVMRGNNLPMSSIFLSELYLLTNQENKYEELKDFAEKQENSCLVLVPDTGSPEEKSSLLQKDYAQIFQKQCLPLAEMLVKDFEIIQKQALPDLFNMNSEQQSEAIGKWVRDKYETKTEFKQELFALWGEEKIRLNEHLSFAEKSLGLNRNKLMELAFYLNDQSYCKIAQFCDEKKFIWESSRKADDKCMELLISLKNWQNLLKRDYVDRILNIVADPALPNHNDLLPDDISALLALHQESIIYRNQLVGFSNSITEITNNGFDYFSRQDSVKNNVGTDSSVSASYSVTEFQDGSILHWDKFDAAMFDFLFENQFSYTIACDGISQENYEELERDIRSLYSDQITSWRDERNGFGASIFNKLKKWKAAISSSQDFEITFYPDKIVIEYTRVKDDERERAVKLLSAPAVEREFKRLQNNISLSLEEEKRFQEIAYRWLAERLTTINNESDSSKQRKMLKNLSEEIRTRSKNNNVKEIFKKILESRMAISSLDLEKQKLLPLLRD